MQEDTSLTEPNQNTIRPNQPEAASWFSRIKNTKSINNLINVLRAITLRSRSTLTLEGHGIRSRRIQIELRVPVEVVATAIGTARTRSI